MASFHQRFVGAVELPKSLSQLDVDATFQLSQKDIVDVRAKSSEQSAWARLCSW